MKYFVELLADFEDIPLGNLYPIDPLTQRFVSEDGCHMVYTCLKMKPVMFWSYESTISLRERTMKYFVELYGNRNLGLLQDVQIINKYILVVYLGYGGCLVVDL